MKRATMNEINTVMTKYAHKYHKENEDDFELSQDFDGFVRKILHVIIGSPDDLKSMLFEQITDIEEDPNIDGDIKALNDAYEMLDAESGHNNQVWIFDDGNNHTRPLSVNDLKTLVKNL